MFTIKKNQIIISALVVMVAAAGYLNYIDSNPSAVSDVMYTEEGDITPVMENVEIDGAAADTADNTDVAAATEATTSSTASVDEAANPNAGEAVFVNSSNDSSYFMQAKLEREESRAKQKDMLNEMLNNKNIDEEKKNEVTTAMLQIQQRIEKETAAEAMIESKGFSEVYVRIDDDTVDVVVDKADLTDAQIAQIEDIVKRKTGISSDKIRISPLKK